MLVLFHCFALLLFLIELLFKECLDPFLRIIWLTVCPVWVSGLFWAHLASMANFACLFDFTSGLFDLFY